MKTLFCLFACMALLPLAAQSPSGKRQLVDEETKDRFWTGSFSSGQYMVSLNHITSVSKQVYILDANLVVYEVNVDTLGCALARFYYVEPFIEGKNSTTLSTLLERSKEVGEKIEERIGSSSVTPQTAVMKQYPTTSHAKTIEYRLMSEKDVNSVYSSLVKAWRTGVGRSFQWKEVK